MEIRRYIVVVLLLVSIPCVAGTNYGGAWQVPKLTGLSAGMGTLEHTIAQQSNVGSVILSINYHTMVDSVDSTDGAGDNWVYTVGMDSLGYYSPDSSGSDGTCIDLNGYMGEFAQIGMFFMGTSADTVFITIEQSLRYDATMGDSGFAYGFIVTDTLFTDSLVGTEDTLITSGASGQGEAQRFFTDSFEVIAPYVRIKFVNLAESTLSNKIHTEMYLRHNSTLMGGSSGRYMREVAPTHRPSSGIRRY